MVHLVLGVTAREGDVVVSVSESGLSSEGACVRRTGDGEEDEVRERSEADPSFGSSGGAFQRRDTERPWADDRRNVFGNGRFAYTSY